MANGWLPARQSALIDWGDNFSAQIAVGETGPAAFGLDAGQQADFNADLLAFKNAAAVTNDPATNSRASYQSKRSARSQFETTARTLVAVCQAWPAMTDEKRTLLQIPQRDKTPTPVPAPSQPPLLQVMGTEGRYAYLKVTDIDGNKARPAGTVGAVILAAVSETAPTNLDAFTVLTQTTKTTESVYYPGGFAEGQKIWLTAYWYGTRGQIGPACSPVETHVGFGGLNAAA